MEPSLASGIRTSSNGLASGTLFLFPNGDRAKTSPPIDKFGGTGSAAAATARLAPREFAFLLAAVLVGGAQIVAGLSIFAGLQLRELQRLGWMVASLQLNPRLAPKSGGAIGGAILFVWLMAIFKTYDADNLYRVQCWLKNVVKSVFIWSVLIWACIGVFRITDFSPRIGVVYCMIALVGFTVGWRLISFALLIQPRVKEAASSRVIVVGWSEKAAHLRQAMRGDLAQLQEIIGCVPLPGGVFATPPPAEVAILGDCAALPQLVHKCQADAIILADVSCAASEIQHLVTFCQREMLHFQMVPEYFPALSSGLQVQTMSGVPLLSVRQLPLDRTINRFLKRLMDIFGALVGLAICAVIVPPFMLLVYLESPGPGHLPPAPDEPQRPHLPYLQDSQHAPQRRGAVRSRLVQAGGSTPVEDRRLHAKDQHRRIAPVLERAHRRHEPGRARARNGRNSSNGSRTRSRTTTPGTRCARASPAGRRSTACAGTPTSPSASRPTSTTSRTGARCSISTASSRPSSKSRMRTDPWSVHLGPTAGANRHRHGGAIAMSKVLIFLAMLTSDYNFRTGVLPLANIAMGAFGRCFAGSSGYDSNLTLSQDGTGSDYLISAEPGLVLKRVSSSTRLELTGRATALNYLAPGQGSLHRPLPSRSFTNVIPARRRRLPRLPRGMFYVGPQTLPAMPGVSELLTSTSTHADFGEGGFHFPRTRLGSL